MTCVHEQIMVAVAAYVRWLSEARGVKKVIWLGNSGGGAYQAQAKAAPGQRLKLTPGGRTATALAGAVMPALDAFMITAAHTGQGQTMNEVIGPSVVDGTSLLISDASFDMHELASGLTPAPQWTAYEPAFVRRYRAKTRPPSISPATCIISSAPRAKPTTLAPCCRWAG